MKSRFWIAAKLSYIARWMPAQMRDQFGGEIEDVLVERLENAANRSWWLLLKVFVDELVQLPGVYFRQSVVGQRFAGEGRAIMGRLGTLFEQNRAPTPWRWTLVGLIAFSITPLMALIEWLLHQGGLEWIGAPSFQAVYYVCFYLIIVGYMLVLVVGWVRGFPTWVYPFVIQFALFSVLAGYDFGLFYAKIEATIVRNLLTLLSVLGLYAFIAAAALLITRMDIKRPIQVGWKGLSEDVARLSFGLFGLAPLMLRVMFDGLHNDPGWMLARDLVLAAGALVYFRARREGLAIGALLATIILAYGATAVNLAVYWSGQQALDLPDARNALQNLNTVLSCAVPIIVFTFGPWWVYRLTQQKPA